MKMVNDRYLSPLLFQMARVFGDRFDGTRARRFERGGARARSSLKIAKNPSSCGIFTRATAGRPCRPSNATAIPLSYLMQAGFDQLKVKRISLQLESFDVKKELNIGAGLPFAERKRSPATRSS